MPNFNSILGGLANVASQIKGAQGQGQNNKDSGNSSYPNQSGGGSAYPNQGGGSAYPNQGQGGYPNQGDSSGYPNQGQGGYSPYPGNQGGGYPPNQGGYGQSQPPSAYQGYPGQAPPPPSGGSSYQSGYPPTVNPSPYPSQNPSPYSSHNSSPYPSGGSQYNQNSQREIGFNFGNNAPNYASGNNAPYPPTDSAPYPSGGNQSGYPQGPPSGAYNNSPYPSNNPSQMSGFGGGYGAPPPPPSQSYGGGYGQNQNVGGGVYPNISQGSYPPQQNQQQQGGPHQPSAPPQYSTSYAPSMNSTPSIRPYPGFNANADAEVLRKAMKGFGCNNDKVVAVLCQRSNWQRQEIAKAFKVMYGKDLIQDLKSELHGDFEDLILALLEPPARFDAYSLHKAMAGLGTKESVLIEIMTTRTNAQIHELKLVYQQMYRRNLEQDLIGETSGHFKRLLVSLCAGGRDESNHTDHIKANQDARNLYRAGERKLGTDESCFNAILASQNMAQLRMVFQEYEKVAKHPIEKAIDSEFSGDIRDGLMAIIKCIRSRPAYFAELLHSSMKGLGTRDTDLVRLVVTRAEIDMRDISQAYQQMFKTSLESTIKGDCSGAYKDGLIALVKGNC